MVKAILRATSNSGASLPRLRDTERVLFDGAQPPGPVGRITPSMPLHNEMAALSESDLRARLDECHKALEAERSVQFEAMKLAVAVFAENKASIDQHVAQIHASKNAVQMLNLEIDSLATAMGERWSPSTSHPPATDQMDPSFTSAFDAMALSQLSGDEQGIILNKLRNACEPRLAMYFSSASK